MVHIFEPDSPPAADRGGGTKKDRTQNTAKKKTKPGPNTQKSCPVPQMSGSNTQTSPGTERGWGGGRQDEIRKKHLRPGPGLFFVFLSTTRPILDFLSAPAFSGIFEPVKSCFGILWRARPLCVFFERTKVFSVCG